MASNHISRLNIAGLRGISQPLELNLNKSLTLIYGENGTGKTSICDAVDLLGNGVVGSLSDISAGSAKHKYWPFIGSTFLDIEVFLELKDSQSWSAICTGKNISVSNEDSLPVVKVWRRKQLMNLIVASPAERFAVISPFIDLSEIEKSEHRLRELKRQVDDDLNNASQRISGNLELIAKMRNAPDETAISNIQWAREELAKPVEEVDDEIAANDTIHSSITTLSTKLNDLVDQSERVDAATSQELRAQEENDRVQSQFDEKVAETLDVLKSAQQYFHKHNEVEECPLCLSKENIQGLGESINHKLDVLSEVQQSSRTLGGAKRKKESAEVRLAEIKEEADNAFNSLIQSINQLEEYPGSYPLVSELAEIENKGSIDLGKLSDIKSTLDSRNKSLEQGKGTLDGLQAAIDTFDENVALQAQNSACSPIINRLLEIHEEKRKAYIDRILSSIAGEVGRLYEAIHPGEGLNQIALQLDPRRRASLEIQSDFLSQTVPPGAYFSNSHLDSLGLCILIAIAKLEDPKNTILVMDDILGSIDEPHVDRVIELLYAESQNFLHTLVTTHYQAWHFKIRRGQLRNANCQLVELGSWNSGQGVSIIDNGRSLLQILETCINDRSNEPEPIASHAGHLLEQLGDFLVTKYECSIPKRVYGNTLNDYLDGLKAKFIQHLKVNVKQSDGTYLEYEVQPLLDELKNIYQVRNTSGAHYNEMANHMPVADIVRFGELVVELGHLLICPDNGFPNRLTQGSYWSTTGETRQLHPLKRP